MCRKMLHPHGFRCSTFFDLAQHPSQEQPSAPISNGLAPVSTATVQAPPTPSPVPQPGQTFPTTPAPGASSPMLLPAQPPSQQPQFPPGVALNNADHAKQAQVAPGARPPSTSAPGLPSQMQQRANAFPGSLSDLVMSFENVKQKGMCLSSSQRTFRLSGWRLGSQRHIGCPTLIRSTSSYREATRACRNHRTRRSQHLHPIVR